MNHLDLAAVSMYVNEHIDTFHQDRVRQVENTSLVSVLRKNPYLSRAKNILKASELIDGALSARLSSSEEELFGNFLEDLAVFVAERTIGGHKSGAQGVDLEFDNEGVHYFVSIKSGPSWGNSSQHSQLSRDLQAAVNVFRQRRNQRIQPDSVLGICYGKTRTARTRSGYIKIVGQNFWTFISGNRELYKQIVEPIGYRAREHNETYFAALGEVSNRLTLEFIQNYCYRNGSINWDSLLEATSMNYDLDRHGF